MSQKERAVAALLLAIAVVGGALIPRLLASSPTPAGVALGPGPAPSRSVVRAPAIPGPAQRVGARSIAPRAALVAPVVSVPAAPPEGPSATSPTRQSRSASPPPPSQPSPPSSPAPTPQSAPAAMTPPPTTSTRPGHGYGDTNHTHTGPPGRPRPPAARSGRDSHGRDLEGSGHGRPVPQAPSQSLGSHHRRVGHLAPPARRPAPADHAARPKARPQARGPRGKGSHGAPPPPVAPSQSQSQGQGQTQSQGHQGHGHGNGNGEDG